MINFLFNKYILRRADLDIYTNGAYWVKGRIKEGKVIGKVIKSKYPGIYNVGKKVEFYLFNLLSDKVPQFKRI